MYYEAHYNFIMCYIIKLLWTRKQTMTRGNKSILWARSRNHVYTMRKKPETSSADTFKGRIPHRAIKAILDQVVSQEEQAAAFEVSNYNPQPKKKKSIRQLTGYMPLREEMHESSDTNAW